jgi:hypothetical protein
MLRSITVLACLGCFVSIASADKGGPPKCRWSKSSDEELEKLARAADCEMASELADDCGAGIKATTKLNEIATDVCRATFAKKSPDLVKDYDAFAKRCEDRNARRSSKELDNKLNTAICKLRAAQLVLMLQ